MSVRKKIVITNGEPVTWWLADYKDGSGRRHQERFKRKAEAEAHEEKSKVAIRSGNYVAVDHDVTVAEAAQVWLDRVAATGMRHRGPVEFATLRQYKQHVSLHIVPRIGAVRLAKLTEKTVEGFRDSLLANEGGEALSRPLARKVLVSLKSILRANKCGDVADDVDLAKVGGRTIDERVDIGALRDVRALHDGVAPLGDDLVRGDLRARFVDVATDDRCPRPSERERGGLSDPAADSGEHGNALGEIEKVLP